MDRRRQDVFRQRGWRWVLVLLGVYLCSAVAQPRVAGDYELKAAVLYQMSRFVYWPSQTLEGQTLNLCLIGEDPFGRITDHLQGKLSQGLPLQVIRLPRPEPQQHCHLAFISRSLRPHLGTLLAQLKHGPVLTVSDISGFAAAGGMVELGVRDGHPAFAINRGAARDAGLDFNAQLLSLASEVLQ